MPYELPFERPLIALRSKIEELREFSARQDIDVTEELDLLVSRHDALERELYAKLTPAERVLIARHPQRPTTLDYISLMCTDFVELSGDRLFGDDAAIVGGIARFAGVPVTIIGHQKGKDTKDNIARNFGMPHPEGFRKALRLMQQADRFDRPIITLIDTPGAYPGSAAEQRGQGEAIARNLAVMSHIGAPIVAVVIGEGGSGGALALGVANRVLMLEHAIYSVISPNGAASILWKDARRADEAAAAMKITATDLQEFGIIDGIVPEVRGGAHRDVQAQAGLLYEAIRAQLMPLCTWTRAQRIAQRYEKFRHIGIVYE